MKDSRQPYQYTYFKDDQLITESTSENVIFADLVVRALQTIDFNRVKSRQTMGYTSNFCSDFGNNSFMPNMST